jgi:hypothetical protein
MYRAQLPRLYELKDLTPDPDSPYAYFRDFETRLRTLPLAFPWYTSLEKRLQYLHVDAWKALKLEASQYLSCQNTNRGWSQLFDILCQADAYRHLTDLGCHRVNFIPRAAEDGQRTPDLECWLGLQKVLCEVKRINISDAERLAREDNTGGTYQGQLSDGFFRQFQSAISRARDQIDAHDPQGSSRHIVYISISFDEGSGFNRTDELRQIEQHLSENPPLIRVGYSAWN